MTDETPACELEGRALDAAVAEEVMGWRDVGQEAGGERWAGVPPTWESVWELPEPSIDMADAMGVAGTFDTWHVERVNDPGGPGSGDFYYKAHCTSYRPEGYGTATADTAPEAICRAALEAVRHASPPTRP